MITGEPDEVFSARGGLEPLPPEERKLGTLDLAVLWGDLGIGLLVLVSGALLVPGLGFSAALAAIILGSVISVALLALVGAEGARYGVPTMVLLRPVLGHKGSWIPSLINGLQLLGWTAVEFWAMSYVANLVSNRLFGIDARIPWLLVIAFSCTALALWGPVGVTRVWLERFGAWVVALVALIITAALLLGGDLASALGFRGDGSITFGTGLDLVIAMPVSWLPLVADYTRLARSPGAAFRGTFVGYLIANIWLYMLGVLLVLGAGALPSPGGMALGILSLLGGSLAGVLLLLTILVGETDEAFADIFSAAVSLRNVFASASQNLLVVAVALLSTGLAALFTMSRYESFLLLIGSVFVPLFGVLVAELAARRSQREFLVTEREFRRGPVVAWLAGFLLFHWLAPTGPEWWVEAVSSILPPAPTWSAFTGGSIPAFLLALFLSWLFGLASGNRSSSETSVARL